MTERPDDVCALILKTMEDGCAIPFLGAGASLPGRPENERDWIRGRYLPSGAELAGFLAKEYRYPPKRREPNRSLVRIAQYAQLRSGEPQLFRDLHARFDVPHEPNVVHRYIAQQPGRQRKRNLPNPWPVIVTTNYDDRLERAFDKAKEDYDLLLFTGDRGAPFRHRAPDGSWTPVRGPRYDAFALERRPVILKLHGGIASRPGEPEHFVITEDHYMAYLADDVTDRLPNSLVATLKDKSFVFLGYRLEDWNVRVFLSRIARDRHNGPVWWAIQRSPTAFDAAFWSRHNVELVELELEAWERTMRVVARRRP